MAKEQYFGWSIQVVFNWRKSIKFKSGKVAFRFIKDRKVNYISTKVKIPAESWDNQRLRVYNHSFSRQFNAYLFEKEQELIDKMVETLGDCTIDDLYEIINSKKREGKTNFNQFCRDELEKENVTETTRKAIGFSLKAMDRFNDSIKFHEINELFVFRFKQHLEQKGLKDGSITKYIRDFSKYWKIAKRSKLVSGDNPCIGLKLKASVGEKDYLNLKEIAAIELLDLQGSIDVSRDMFLLACYTGLSYVEISNLKHSDIEKGDNWYIKGKRSKSKVKFECNISLLFWGKPKAIIEKYKGELFEGKRSGRTIWEHCKEMGDLAETGKYITFHVGRTSFRTNLTMLGMSDQMIDGIGGWKSKGMKSIYNKNPREYVDKRLLEIFK